MSIYLVLVAVCLWASESTVVAETDQLVIHHNDVTSDNVNYTVTVDDRKHVYKKQDDDDDDDRGKKNCPSHCDENGQHLKPSNCVGQQLCCKFGKRLECCSNSSLAIGEDIKDGYNCVFMPHEYWQLVLAVCVPLATLSLIAFLAMTSYLMCRKRRERQTRNRQRSGSGSDLSCSSWSVSTVSPAETMRGNPCRSSESSEHTCSRRQRSHGPPLEIFVLGPLLPPPYVDKPPPYSNNNNSGEPNSGFETGDMDSLPDYETVIMDPLSLVNDSNREVVVTVAGADIEESDDNPTLTMTYGESAQDSMHTFDENIMDNAHATLNESINAGSIVSVNDGTINSNTVTLQTVDMQIENCESETDDFSNSAEDVVTEGDETGYSSEQDDCCIERTSGVTECENSR